MTNAQARCDKEKTMAGYKIFKYAANYRSEGPELGTILVSSGYQYPAKNTKKSNKTLTMSSVSRQIAPILELWTLSVCRICGQHSAMASD